MHALLPVLALLGGMGCTDEPVDRPSPQNCLPYEDPHDGVDQDCDPANEFDFDGDGFVVDRIWSDTQGWVDALEIARLYALSKGLPLDVQGGDCDDFDASVYPGAPGEQPYDAVDTDCDGGNDFDADGDGWIPVGYWNEVAYYVANALDGQQSFTVLEGDCDDLDPLIHPDMPDTPYDGVDSDCDFRNEFDDDGDHYIASGFEAAYREHVAIHGEQHPVAGFGDCDDVNNFVNPGAAERPFTPRDVDCDGDSERPRLQVHSLGIAHGGPAVFAQNNDLEALVLGADAAGGFDSPGVYGVVIPVIPEPGDAIEVIQLSDTRTDRLAMRPHYAGLTVTAIEDDRFAHIPIAAGFLGAFDVSPFVWTDGIVPGDQVVADPQGDFACGGGPTTWLDGTTHTSADVCGVVEGDPVLCSDTCIQLASHADVVLPWVAPTRITGQHALVDGRVQAPDGTQPFSISEADDASVSGGHAAWIVDGEVYIQGSFGVVGPLIAAAAEGPSEGERTVQVPFYADEVHIGSYWGYVTLFALAHDGATTRIAMARLDP